MARGREQQTLGKHLIEADGSLTCLYHTFTRRAVEPGCCEDCGRPLYPTIKRAEWRVLRKLRKRQQAKERADRKLRDTQLRRWRYRYVHHLTNVPPPKVGKALHWKQRKGE